jgi:hypothetical protein
MSYDQLVRILIFRVGVVYSGEYDVCDVTLSVYPHRANLKNMPGHDYTASSPSDKGGTADNTSRNEIRPLFALVKLAPPLHKHHYIQLNLSNRKPLMSCLFTGCIKKQVIELQRAILPELLGVFMPSGEKISKYEFDKKC